MASEEKILCNGCMSSLEKGEICPCGYENTPNKFYHLKCDTLLRGNFLIGRVILLDGESTLYIGYDREKQEKIFIKEYFPYPLSKRHENRETVIPVLGKEVQYKTLMADFEELAKLEVKLSKDYNVLAPYDILGDNNTVYAIYPYYEFTTIKKYMADKGEPLLWADMKGAFLQLCSTVAAIHKEGIIHRGISDTTILVDEGGHIYLTGFSTVPNRTADSEVRSTLYENFSAPEQYNPTMWQGDWTDIYSLSALLYKCLTGVNVQKDSQGKILPPINLNKEIPTYVSDTICSGLIENYDYRIKDICSFTALLLEDVSSNTAVFTEKAVKPYTSTEIPFDKDIQHTIHGGTTIIEGVENALKTQKETEKSREKGKQSYKILAMCMGVFVCLSLLFMWVKNKDLEQPEQEQPTITPIITLEMPNFVGERADNLTKDQNFADNFKFIIKEEFSDEVNYGEVISQMPKAGEKYVNKPNVILTVSMGMRSVKMPNILGNNITEAMNKLDALKLKYEVFEVVDDELTAGIVGRTNFNFGDAVDIYDDVVYIYTGSGETTKEQNNSSTDN